jgi:hypothetical protein
VNGGEFTFALCCRTCGPRSRIIIHCPRASWNLSGVTHKCCGHLFVGPIVLADRRMSARSLTSPTMRMVNSHEDFHPFRVTARVLLRVRELAPEQLAFIRHCVSSQVPMQRTIGTRNQDVCAVPHQESSWSYDGRETVTLAWLAPWAVSGLRSAD